MPRRSIWSARQRAALFDLPTDEAALLRHYTLSDYDIEAYPGAVRGHNRLGFAPPALRLSISGAAAGGGGGHSPDVLCFIERPSLIAAQLGMARR